MLPDSGLQNWTSDSCHVFTVEYVTNTHKNVLHRAQIAEENPGRKLASKSKYFQVFLLSKLLISDSKKFKHFCLNLRLDANCYFRGNQKLSRKKIRFPKNLGREKFFKQGRFEKFPWQSPSPLICPSLVLRCGSPQSEFAPHTWPSGPNFMAIENVEV